MNEKLIKKREAVFFDRDGVLNIDKGYVYRTEDFIWIEGAKEAIKLLNDLGYLVIIVTNQSGIARGYYEEKDVYNLHQWMRKELFKTDAHIDGIYYCPHHPQAIIDKYRKDCQCRKPAPGLILQAINELSINKRNSFLIGDNERDIEAAKSAGIDGYLFRTKNLLSFTKKILLEHYNLLEVL